MANLKIVPSSSLEITIQQAFEKEKLTVEFGRGCITIFNKKKESCEFYGEIDFENTGYFATYEVDGEEKELKFFLPEDLNIFVETVKKIMK